MKFENGMITLEKELSVLDQFVLDFVKLLEPHKYVLVSGYVSILFGRSRGSEDIDILLAPMKEKEFLALFDELIKNDFECITVTKKEAFHLITDKTALRFARKGTAIPNMEIKFAEKPIHLAAINNCIKVRLDKQLLFISPIELQIVYKRLCLGSDKDNEDALHLEIVFEGKLSQDKLNNYTHLIRQHGC